jgi:hypothetical protein
MTFVEVLAAMIIFTLFMTGFSQACRPLYLAGESARAEYKTAHALFFIAESFKQECAKPDRDIERWKKTAAAVKELQSCEITELWQGEILRALKAACVVSGEYIEIIGVCTP